jgi:hypothetical protein
MNNNADRAHSWFSEPSLPEVSLVSTSDSDSVLGNGETTSNTGISNLTLKDLISILKNRGTLTKLEWLILLSREDEFEEIATHQLKDQIKLIWIALFKDNSMLNNAINRVARGIAQDYDGISPLLSHNIPTDSNQISCPLNKRRITWLSAVVKDDFSLAANISKASNQTAYDLANEFSFDSEADYLSDILKLSAEVLPSSPSAQEQVWWINCQDKVERNEKIRQIEIVVEKLTVLEKTSPLSQWFENYCLPEATKTLWYSLTEKTQKLLSSLYKVTSFNLIEKCFEELKLTGVDSTLSDERDKNRLEKRISFWQSYENSFKTVRFLLTQRAYILIKNRFDVENSRFIVMDENYQNNRSEICIFEFERWVFVEFFRGTNPDTDIRIYDKKSKEAEFLLSENDLDSTKILLQNPKYSFSHIPYWQYVTREYLKRELRVSPRKFSLIERWHKPDTDKMLPPKEYFNRCVVKAL